MTTGIMAQSDYERSAIASGNGRRERPAASLAAAFASALLMAGLVAGCAGIGDSTFERALALAIEESGGAPALENSRAVENRPELHSLSRWDLQDGPEAVHLGAARMLRQQGLFGLLGDYIVNVPSGAIFLPNFEIMAAWSASYWANSETGTENPDSIKRRFERQILIATDNASLGLLRDSLESVELHDAFYEVFERCGRNSPWPEAKLAERQDHLGGDVLYLEPEWGISQYEYRELLHVCGRYAATYPNLNPTERDEMLAPQREYYAEAVLNRIDNELPSLEIPPEYKNDVDELRANGW